MAQTQANGAPRQKTEERAGFAAGRLPAGQKMEILPFGRIKDPSALRIACVYNGQLFHVALTEILALAKAGEKP